jgi:hypothetical protein
MEQPKQTPQQKYREKNKDTIRVYSREYNKEKITCICGKTMRRDSYRIHIKDPLPESEHMLKITGQWIEPKILNLIKPEHSAKV